MFDIPRLAYWTDNALCLEWSGLQSSPSLDEWQMTGKRESTWSMIGSRSFLTSALFAPSTGRSINTSFVADSSMSGWFMRSSWVFSTTSSRSRSPPAVWSPLSCSLGSWRNCSNGWRSVVECRLRQENSRIELPCFSSAAWASDHRKVCICILVEEDSREIVMHTIVIVRSLSDISIMDLFRRPSLARQMRGSDLSLLNSTRQGLWFCRLVLLLVSLPLVLLCFLLSALLTSVSDLKALIWGEMREIDLTFSTWLFMSGLNEMIPLASSLIFIAASQILLTLAKNQRIRGNDKRTVLFLCSSQGLFPFLV